MMVLVILNMHLAPYSLTWLHPVIWVLKPDKDSTNTPKGFLTIKGNIENSITVNIWQVNSVTTATGYRKIGVTYVSGSIPTDGQQLVLDFSRAADVGTSGTSGTSSTSGTSGVSGTSGTSGIGIAGTSGTSAASSMIKYSPVVYNCINTTTETAIFSVSISANTWLDGEFIAINFNSHHKQNCGAAAKLSIKI